MTTSPRFFAATLTVLAETRFVDVRACIILAFESFACEYVVEGSVARPSTRLGSGSGSESANREPSILSRRARNERAWIRIFRIGIGYV